MNFRAMKRKVLVFVCVATMLGGQLPCVDVAAKAWDVKATKEELKLRFWENKAPDYRFYINAGERYILETVTKPEVGSTFGEWSVMDLLRGAYSGMDYLNYIPENYFTDYETRVENYVKDKNGILDRSKSTEWSRITLSMTAMGHSIKDVGGFDFVDKLSQSYKFSYKQGINGPIWEIIALNTGGYSLYETPSTFKEGDINSIGKMIDYICGKEITQRNGQLGGFALTGNVPDPDVTAMALQAFAPYYKDAVSYEAIKDKTSYEDMCKVVERGVLVLSQLQKANGGYESWGSINSESISQVIVALTALGIDPLASDVKLTHIASSCGFVKEGEIRDGVVTNNMVDALLTFYANESGSSVAVGGFKHVTAGYDGGGNAGSTVNAMATDQAVYGLVAYDRFVNGQLPLYDMSDQKDGSYVKAKAKNYTIEFNGNGKGETKRKDFSPFAEVLLSAEGTGDGFVEWNTKADGSGNSYVPGELLSMPEQDITLYAIYGTASFHIDWELNGGVVAEGCLMKGEYTSLEEYVLPTKQQISKDGCEFNGWFDNAKCTGTPITCIPQGSYGDKSFYAGFSVDWQPINAFYELVSALPTKVTSKDQSNVVKARELYEEMAEIQKAEVLNSTLKRLEQAEQELAAVTSKPIETDSEEQSDNRQESAMPAQTNVPIVSSIPTISLPTISLPPVASQSPTQTEIPKVSQEPTKSPVASQNPKPQVTASPAAIEVSDNDNPSKLAEAVSNGAIKPIETSTPQVTKKPTTVSKTIKERVVISKATKWKKNGIYVKLKKAVKNADGYVLYLYKGNKKARAKKVIFKGTTKKISKLKKKNVYYVRICAYKLDKYGNKIYGPISGWKRIKL